MKIIINPGCSEQNILADILQKKVCRSSVNTKKDSE